MRIFIQLGFIFAAWRFADWRNWRKYYPSMLFLIIGDLVYNFVCYNYSLWTFNPVTFDKILYRNHTIITLTIDFLSFPSMVLLYLSKYPTGKIKQFLYVIGWSSLNTVLETISYYFTKGILYHHGWSLAWSAGVNILLFSILPIHHIRPLAAWIIFWLAALFFMLHFGIPISKMK